MAASRHPQDETLAAFAAGAIAPGLRLVVDTHVQGCRECRERLRVFEAVGGALLEAAERSAPSPDLLARTFAAIEARQEAPAKARESWSAPFPGAPATLQNCEIGPWRFIMPGLRIAFVKPPGDANASAMLMRVKAGFKMPRHTHDGVEFTQVLSGSYSDVHGRYQPGDFDEADGEIDHRPAADSDEDCFCLSAIEGRLRLTSFVGGMIQSALGL